MLPKKLSAGRRLDAIWLMALGAMLMTSGCGGGSGSEAVPAGESAASREHAAAAAVEPVMAQAGVTALDLAGPHEPAIDRFNPDRREVRPALGGRVIQHISAEPPNLNFATENSAIIRHIHFVIHAGLLEFNPATWEYDPVLATGYDVEDTIILTGGRGDDNSNIVFGRVREEGDGYLVTSGSPHNPIAERHIPEAEVESVERGTVFTFHLRDDVRWHDGERFDAEDVHFSWQIYSNPHVDCDEKRYQYAQVPHAEILDAQTVRFFYREQYFGALQAFGLGLCILPSHLYNLADSTNPDHDPGAGAEQMGAYINNNPHNIDWVGLGPYHLTRWERGRYLEAERFADYFETDPAETGYLDVIRWTHIDDDNVAFQALLNGEVDIFDRLKSEDFMGAATQEPIFTDQFYKAFTYLGSVGFTVWNTYRPQLADARVRTALSHAWDVRGWIRTSYKGLALPATFSMFRFGPGYNQEVVANPYDPERARQLLSEAGWYDRDGDGIVDKDGTGLTIELLMPSGNKASETFLQSMQESFEQVGIKVTIQPFEWATFLERILERNFDGANLAWTLGDIEGDPFGSWHGSEAEHGRRTGNMSGLRDAVVDSLIESGRRELQPEKRHVIWKELHARIYELQPFLWGQNVPRKIAFSKQLRGVKLYKFSPGYRLRDFYYEEGTPGTRPVPAGT